MQTCTGHERRRMRPLVGILTAVCLLLPVSLAAGRGGPDAFGYTWVDSNEPDGPPLENFDYDSFNSGGDGTNDWISAPDLPLPFTFFFYEQGYDTFQLSDNVWASFVPQTDPYPTPTMLPAAGQGPSGMIAPLWTDLALIRLDHGPILGGRGYKIYWIGHLPSRTAVDIIVYLFDDGRIRFNYVRARADGTSAVGIEDHTETTGLTLQFENEAFGGFALRDFYAVEFTPPQDLACEDAVPVACGDTIVSGPPPQPPDPDARVYCASGSYKAAEQVFRLDVDRPLDVSAAISGFDPRELDLFLFEGCREMDCLTGGEDQLAYELPRKGAYYFAVDGDLPSDEGPFELTVDCTDPYPALQCGDRVAGTVTGRPSRKDAHECPFLQASHPGPDNHYSICLPEDGTLRLNLESAVDLDLMVYKDNVDAGSCVDWGDNAVTLFGAEAACYYIFVDGDAGIEGDYVLETSCKSLLDCDAAEPLTCGETVAGDTAATGTDRLEIYPCTSNVYDGPEALFSFVNPELQNVSFLLEGAPPEMDLLLARECDEGYCYRMADDALHVKDLEPGVYSVYVDGRDAVGGGFSLTTICGPSLSPKAIDITLDAGETWPEEKFVYLTPDIPKLDIMVAMDTSSSMREELPVVKNHIRKIINEVLLLGDDVWFGVINFEDYYQTYAGLDNCDYEAPFGGWYGWDLDEPYVLHQPLTPDDELFELKVWTVADYWGRDEPASYSRVLWETVHDDGIGWRPGSRRFVLMFGDAVPHDCELDACVGGGLLTEPSTGKDPGRDEMINTADDVTILGSLAEMAEDQNDIVLLHFESSEKPEFQTLWDCWTAITGGTRSILDRNGNPVPPLDIADVVIQELTEKKYICQTLTLTPSAGYEDWLLSIDPPERTGVVLPVQTSYSLVFQPPLGTPPGIYQFTMDLHCEGVLVAQQDVTIRVGECLLAAAASAEPVTACAGTRIELDASDSVAVDCDGEVQYRWTRDGELVRDFDPSPLAEDVMGEGAATYTVEMECVGGTFCTGASSASVRVFATPDPLPAPVGASLRVERSGDADIRVRWTDLPVPPEALGEYELLGLDAEMTGDPTPLAVEGATVLGTASPGVQSLVHAGGQGSPCPLGTGMPGCRLLFYKVRATSACTSRPGPACNGFPAQVPCP